MTTTPDPIRLHMACQALLRYMALDTALTVAFEIIDNDEVIEDDDADGRALRLIYEALGLSYDAEPFVAYQAVSRALKEDAYGPVT